MKKVFRNSGVGVKWVIPIIPIIKCCIGFEIINNNNWVRTSRTHLLDPSASSAVLSTFVPPWSWEGNIHIQSMHDLTNKAVSVPGRRVSRNSFSFSKWASIVCLEITFWPISHLEHRHLYFWAMITSVDWQEGGGLSVVGWGVQIPTWIVACEWHMHDLIIYAQNVQFFSTQGALFPRNAQHALFFKSCLSLCLTSLTLTTTSIRLALTSFPCHSQTLCLVLSARTFLSANQDLCWGQGLTSNSQDTPPLDAMFASIQPLIDLPACWVQPWAPVLTCQSHPFLHTSHSSALTHLQHFLLKVLPCSQPPNSFITPIIVFCKRGTITFAKSSLKETSQSSVPCSTMPSSQRCTKVCSNLLPNLIFTKSTSWH